MSSDPFNEIPSTWLTPRAAVELMVRKLNVEPGEAARALVAAIVGGEVPHRLLGEVIFTPVGCDYSWDIPWSGRWGKRLVVKHWGSVEKNWGQGTAAGFPIEVSVQMLEMWMHKNAAALKALASRAAAPDFGADSAAGADRGEGASRPGVGDAVEVKGAAPGSGPKMGSADANSPPDHRKPFNFRAAKALIFADKVIWESNGCREWAPTNNEIEAKVRANFAEGWTRTDIRRLHEVYPKEFRPRGPRPKRAPPRPPNSAESAEGRKRKS